MYAIVEIAGQQFKVQEGKKIFVHRLEAEHDKEIEFDKVLLIEDEGRVVIGDPTIKEAVVDGKVLDNVRGDKVIVFKKKRKKGYRIKNGHRQNFTQVEIISIREKGAKKAPKKEAAHAGEKSAEAVAAAETKVSEKKTAAKKETGEKAEKKAAPAKKAPVKKAATEKKAAAKPSKK